MVPDRPRSSEEPPQAAGVFSLKLLNALVLAAIVKRPSYGYEISARLNRQCAAFLEVNSTNVYTKIDSLARRHLIEVAERPPSSKRAVRVVYKATREGAKAYRAWIAGEPARVDQVELLAKLAMAGPLGPRGIRIVLKRHEQACIRVMAQLDALEDQSEEPTQSVESFIASLVISTRRASLEADRRAMQEAWSRVDEFEGSQPR